MTKNVRADDSPLIPHTSTRYSAIRGRLGSPTTRRLTDLQDRAATANLAVQARNNPGHADSTVQTVSVIDGLGYLRKQAGLAHPCDGDKHQVATDCVSPHIKPQPAAYILTRVVVQ